MEGLINIQYLGLQCARKVLSDSSWKKAGESFLTDLRVPGFDELLRQEALDHGFRSTVTPLMELAGRVGFQSGWRPNT